MVDTSPNRSGLIERPVQPASDLTGINDYVLFGENSASSLLFLKLTPPEVPVISSMVATKVAIAWMSDNIPAGDWVATLQRRPVNGDWSDVATYTFSTS